MTTYGAVMFLVIAAAVLVLLAIWHQVEGGGRRRDRRWVALGGSFTVAAGQPSWVSALRLTGPPVEGIDLTSPGALLADVMRAQIGPALAARPGVAVIWVGPDDLLHGRPLPDFLADLGTMIRRLRANGVAVIVVGMPPIGWPAAVGEGRRPARAMAPALTDWRDGLADVARYLGATMIKTDGPTAIRAELVREGPWTILTAPGRTELGSRLSSIVQRELWAGSGEDVSGGEHEEPADPVIRRRLGLPPLR